MSLLAATAPRSGASPATSSQETRDILALQSAVLTPDAASFVAELARQFGASIDALLTRRNQRRARIARGEEKLDFLPNTAAIREGDWRVAPTPRDLERRIVE